MDLIYRYDPFQPMTLARPQDAQAAAQALIDGNRRLTGLVHKMQRALVDADGPSAPVVVPMDLVSMGLPFLSGAACQQSPFAMVLGCSDARVPIESLFDQSFNDLFVVRIAGNVLGTECVGSFDFAVRNLGGSLKAVVVLGHTGCGAVTAAVDAYLRPGGYADMGLSYPLRSLVDRILIAVRGAASALDRRHGHAVHRQRGYREALIEASVYLNAAITAFDLRREVALLAPSDVDVFFGVCDIGTMVVRSSPARADASEPELSRAPRNAEELANLTGSLVGTIAANSSLSGNASGYFPAVT